MADVIYSNFKKAIGEGLLNLGTDTLKCMLVTSAYVPSAAHAAYAEVSGHEVSGSGYAAGGQGLSGVTWAIVGTSAVLDAADPSWSEATITARYAVVYADKTAGGVVGPLVCLLDFGTEKGVSGGTFSVVFDAGGIVTLN